MPPTTSADFDDAYRQLFTIWGDFRIPPELRALARRGSPQSSLELGCGVGRFTNYLARQGLTATGVDFSPVAIGKGQARAAEQGLMPRFLVGDVTQLSHLSGRFDFSFDVGCFHCLEAPGQQAYSVEVARLLAPGGVHLIWALDDAPGGLRLAPAAVESTFAENFRLLDARTSRRRLARSHWYWLERV